MIKCRFLRKGIACLAMVLLSLAWIPTGHCLQPDNPKAQIAPEYMVYYFYMGKRCSTCEKIEEWSAIAVKDDLKEQVDTGRLQWQALNIDQPENKHFAKDFQLYTKSVIVAEYKNGKPVRWENLPDIWRLSHDQNKFIDYVAGEIRKFMERK
jgi:hypothetical protein